MLTLLAMIPWVVAVAYLLIVVSRKDINQDYDDYITDDTEQIKVAVCYDKAYWVYNNVFYQSELMWEPDFTTASPIDTMSLSHKEMTELLEILDELKEQEKG